MNLQNSENDTTQMTTDYYSSYPVNSSVKEHQFSNLIPHETVDGNPNMFANLTDSYMTKMDAFHFECVREAELEVNRLHKELASLKELFPHLSINLLEDVKFLPEYIDEQSDQTNCHTAWISPEKNDTVFTTEIKSGTSAKYANESGDNFKNNVATQLWNKRVISSFENPTSHTGKSADNKNTLIESSRLKHLIDKVITSGLKENTSTTSFAPIEVTNPNTSQGQIQDSDDLHIIHEKFQSLEDKQTNSGGEVLQDIDCHMEVDPHQESSHILHEDNVGQSSFYQEKTDSSLNIRITDSLGNTRFIKAKTDSFGRKCADPNQHNTISCEPQTEADVKTTSGNVLSASESEMDDETDDYGSSDSEIDSKEHTQQSFYRFTVTEVINAIFREKIQMKIIKNFFDEQNELARRVNEPDHQECNKMQKENKNVIPHPEAKNGASSKIDHNYFDVSEDTNQQHVNFEPAEKDLIGIGSILKNTPFSLLDLSSLVPMYPETMDDSATNIMEDDSIENVNQGSHSGMFEEDVEEKASFQKMHQDIVDGDSHIRNVNQSEFESNILTPSTLETHFERHDGYSQDTNLSDSKVTNTTSEHTEETIHSTDTHHLMIMRRSEENRSTEEQQILDSKTTIVNERKNASPLVTAESTSSGISENCTSNTAQCDGDLFQFDSLVVAKEKEIGVQNLLESMKSMPKSTKRKICSALTRDQSHRTVLSKKVKTAPKVTKSNDETKKSTKKKRAEDKQ